MICAKKAALKFNSYAHLLFGSDIQNKVMKNIISAEGPNVMKMLVEQLEKFLKCRAAQFYQMTPDQTFYQYDAEQNKFLQLRDSAGVMSFVLQNQAPLVLKGVTSVCGYCPAVKEITERTAFRATALIMDPANAEKEPPPYREILRKPKGKEVTVKLVIYAFHMFINMCEKYDNLICEDALDVILKLTDIQLFCMSTRMLLDSSNFALMFLESSDELKHKACDLLNRIHRIAEETNNVDVLVATNSIYELFPEAKVDKST